MNTSTDTSTDLSTLQRMGVRSPLLSFALALVAAALLAGCAPTVTETGDAEGDAPSFEAGEVEHGAFVEPPLDPASIAAVTEDRPLRIVTTVGQITALVEAVGGERVEVTQIVPGADDPHMYVPTPGDVAAFSEADAILYNGLFLEGQMGETFKQMAALGIPTVAVTAGFDGADLLEREYSPGEFVTDPHVWFDPALWGQAAANVATVVTKFVVRPKQGHAPLDRLGDVTLSSAMAC